MDLSAVRGFAAKNWWQLCLVACAALAVLLYRTHLEKVEQAALVAAQEQRAARLASDSQREAADAQRKQEYVAKRRGDCYDIYSKERARYNNVEGPEYDADEDVCRIRYKDNKPRRTREQCSRLLPDKEAVSLGLDKMMRREHFNCLSHTFTNEF